MRRIATTLLSLAHCAALMLATKALPLHAQSIGADRPQIAGPLTLMQAVHVGLHENLMIRAARADQRAAAAETRIARSMTLPQLAATTYLSYGDVANILATAPNVTPTGSLLAPAQGFADQNVTLMAPLYTGNRLENQIRAAQARERATAADATGTEAETVLRITEAYDRVLLAAEMVKAMVARVEADTELVKTTRSQYDAGKGLQASVERVRAEQADAERALSTARNTQAKALLDLKVAMGIRLDSDITLTDSLVFNPPHGDLKSQLAAAATRPELLAVRERDAAAKASVTAARGASEPQVYATAMADGFASHAPGARGGYTVAVVVSLPLFDGGQRRAESARARAQQERSRAEARDAELRIASEVEQAWLDVQTAAANYATAETALRSAQSAYEVTALRVQNQKGLVVEQLDALAALSQARANRTQALYDHASAAARLQRAVGDTTSWIGR